MWVAFYSLEKKKKRGRPLAIFKQLQHSLAGGGDVRKRFVSGNLDPVYLLMGLCRVMLSPDSKPSAQGKFTAHTRGLFPQCGASWLRAFSWMSEPLGSCALCPMSDYKLPRRWSASHSGWGRRESRNPTAGADASDVLLCRPLSCLPRWLTAPQPLPLRAPSSWISSQAAANADALSPVLQKKKKGLCNRYPQGGVWNHWAQILVGFQESVRSESSLVYS